MSRMKIAIIYPPIPSRAEQYPLLGQNRQFRFSHSDKIRIYPLIPASAATLLAQNGFDVLFLDGINQRLIESEFMRQLLDFNPDMVMLETKAPVIKTHWRFINQFKKEQKRIKTVLVGDHVSFFPMESFKYCMVDYCLTGGDYDVSLLNLARHLRDSAPIPQGAYYLNGWEIKNTGRHKLIENLDSLPFIDRQLTRWQTYGEAYLHQPCTYILSGRGCGGTGEQSGRCSFCIWQHAFWDCTARLRTPLNVADEIEMLIKNYRIKEVFDDNEAGAVWNKEWLEDFHRRLVQKRLLGKVILSSNARADSLDKDTCRILRKCGYRLLKVGLESGNEKTLERLNKGESLSQIIKGIKTAKYHGLEVMLTMMVGYPWETEEDVQETYRIAKELMLYKTHFGDSLQVSVVIPYPGTPLYRESVKQGWFVCDKDDYDAFDMEHPILRTPVDTNDWCHRIWKLHSQPKFLMKSFISMRNFNDFKLALGGVKSLLGHLKDYGNLDEDKHKTR